MSFLFIIICKIQTCLTVPYTYKVVWIYCSKASANVGALPQLWDLLNVKKTSLFQHLFIKNKYVYLIMIIYLNKIT